MSKKLQLLLSLFAVILCLPVIGQDFSTEYGKIGREEFELEQYALDPEAEAVVLFDKGRSRFEDRQGSFEVIFERETRLKILSEAGVKYAEIEIPYYQEGTIYERIYDLEAYTYNFEDGKIIKTPLDIANTYEVDINKFWKAKKFAIPNVKPGSIIEYKYRLRSPNVLSLRDWRFQWRIPVDYSEYEVRMIPHYAYVYLLQGTEKFDSYTTNRDSRKRVYEGVDFYDTVHTYVMNEVPAFKSEEFITSINDYIIKIEFQLASITYHSLGSREIMTTWEKMGTHLLKHPHFGNFTNRSERLAKRVLNINDLKSKSEEERFNFVLDYVKNNYNWNRIVDKYTTKSPNNFIKDKYGNSAEINLFTVGLLNAVGIDARPVLISTRRNGKIKYAYPILENFNDVIILATIDGNKVLSDASNIFVLNNRISPRAFNDRGLIVDRKKVDWLGLEFQLLSEVKNDIQIEIPSNHLMTTSISKSATEYEAVYYRHNYGEDHEAIKRLLKNKHYAIIDSTISVQNQNRKEKPYILSYKQTSKPEVINEKIYIPPFLNQVISDNPLKEAERTYPIDMVYPNKRTFTTTIIIPEGYQVDYIPKEKTIMNQMVELTYNAIQEDNKIKVSFSYAFNKAIYSQNIYSDLKSFFDEIVEHGNEKIVLSKKI